MERTFRSYFRVGDVVADRVASFELVEELGRPFELLVEVQFANELNAEDALGLLAALSFGIDDAAQHTFVGVVERVTVVGSANTGAVGDGGSGANHAVRFRVVSRIGLLAGSFGAEIFQDKTVEEIVTEVLEAHGIPAKEQRWNLTATYAKREYCVRYFETALAFVSRLLEEEGIFFRSVVEDEKEILVFADDSASAPPIEGDPELPMRGQTGFAIERDAIFALRELAAVQSGAFVLRDYDFKRPSLDLTASATAEHDTGLERYDYPGLYVDKAVGEQLAKVRLEAEQVQREGVEILAECARLYAGTTFSLTEFDLEDDRSGTQLVKRVVHTFGRRPSLDTDGLGPFAEREAKTPTGYVAHAKLIPVEVPYRTPQTTPRPIVYGPQTATVMVPAGSSSETIHTDEFGRCKVKFHWDLSPTLDEKASCWIRTTQLQTSGSMALPRVGWEVVVEFLEGNPDRPVVTGKVYNGLFMPPYQLPEGATRTQFSSNSSPGAGGSNTIRIEDRAGGEEVMIHAQHDQTIATANNKKTTVGNNATRVVGGNETIEVGGDAVTKITMGAQLTVGADRSVSVGGNQNREINAVSGLTVAGSSTTDVGGNHFEMDGNPLEALLAIATEVAIEAAQAAASQAMERINGAIQSRVDQAMAPVNDLLGQAEQISAGMEAVANGDVGAIGGMVADAAGLPLPPGFGGGDGGGEAAGAGAGDAGEGGEGAGEGGEEEQSYTQRVGLDAAVNGAIDRGIRGGAAALGEALGLGGGGGGGGSENLANVDGPAGDVGGLSETDRAKGPGHNTHKVDGSYSESVGSMRLAGVLLEVHDEIAGNLTEKVGVAKVTGAIGDITADIGGNKTLQTLGRLVFTPADESESAGGSVTTMVGGLVYDRVKGSYTISAGAPATFIGAFAKLEAKTAITLTCGASSLVIDGSGVSLTSPIVTIIAGKVSLTKAVAEN